RTSTRTIARTSRTTARARSGTAGTSSRRRLSAEARRARDDVTAQPAPVVAGWAQSPHPTRSEWWNDVLRQGQLARPGRAAAQARRDDRIRLPADPAGRALHGGTARE